MKKTILFFALTAFTAGSGLSALTISIYHTSDVHGWYSARPAKWDKENSTRTIGGFAALSSLVAREKNPYLLLDSGDTFQGTPEGSLTRGMASVALMNRLGYSAAAVGNHEYDYSEDNLKLLAADSSFPWLGANVYVKASGTRPSYLRPYTIIEKAGKKIAVIGLAGRHTSNSTLPLFVNHLEFRDEPAEAARWTEEVKRSTPDAIVILAHLGLGANTGPKADISTWTLTGREVSDGTLQVARAAKGAAVVLGGHNHVGFTSGYYDKTSGVLIVESGFELTDVGKVDLKFDDATGKFKGAEAALIPLWTDKTGEAPEITAMIKKFSEQAAKEMDVTIGESETDLGFSPSGLDSAIGNWVTDVMRRKTGTEIAFQNTAGIRAEMKKGLLKLRDIYQVMPFENTLVTLKLTGAQIRRLIAENLKDGKTRLQMSGLTARFRLSPEGKPEDLVVERDGSPIAPEAEFTVVTNNYLAGGGTGGRIFSEGAEFRDTSLPIRDFLIKDVKTNSPLTLPSGRRFIRLE
ncbi:MAG: bifunctional UDP-sugar hydrolase/5'-nucleotidase [Elusimicrobiales bacterium]|jgi:2',3'-cyclic-nucleotide 2'-phosphodiesterase/3'-nucleotidase